MMIDETESSSDPSLSHRARLALRAGRESEGIELLRKGVREGDADCQCFLAAFYLEGGAGIEKNPSEARRLYELSVAQYNLMGTYLYGITLFFGKGLPKEKARGLRLVKRAALMGVVDAQTFLSAYYGRRLWHGTKAVAWTLVAARSGDEGARKVIEERGLPSPDAQDLAERISSSITILKKLLLPLDSEAALQRLEEMVEEI